MSEPRQTQRINFHKSHGASLEDRFWAKVDRRGPDDCWEWLAGRKPSGYGAFMVNPTVQDAHKTAWELTHGPVPEGLEVCHECDNPPCCNPRHLFLGTHDQNMKDMVEKGRQAVGEQHGRSKLTEALVLQMRSDHADKGVAIKQLARTYNIPRPTVKDAIKRKTWKHI